jgi:hypothetical protein
MVYLRGPCCIQQHGFNTLYTAPKTKSFNEFGMGSRRQAPRTRCMRLTRLVVSIRQTPAHKASQLFRTFIDLRGAAVSQCRTSCFRRAIRVIRG